MDLFRKIIGALGALPAAVAFWLFPALFLLACVALWLFRKKGAFGWTALLFGALGFLFAYCKDNIVAFVWLSFYLLLCVLMRLFLQIPRKGKRDRARMIYEKFREPLEVPEEEPEEAAYPAEESGLKLEHASVLLEKLEKCDLSAGDRLEADSLKRVLEGSRGRALSEEEMRAVNDCLATVLKLTAKYKL